MAFQLAGYFPKSTAVPAYWQHAANVREICSVSDCIAPSPEGWINRWLHNDLGFFNTLEDARAVIPASAQNFTVFAYRLFLERFADGVGEPLVIPPLQIEAIPDDFVSLGFDIVTKNLSDFFECSPLSCNGMAAKVPVNSCCLISDAEVAISLAAQFSKSSEVEPGYYHVIEVLRSKK